MSLYPYQLQASQAMVNLEEQREVKLDDNSILSTSIGILGGEAGIGKTAIVLQTIYNYTLKNTPTNIENRTIIKTVGNGSTITSLISVHVCNTTLVIAGGSVRAQWKTEQEMFFPSLTCRVVENVRQLKKINPFDYNILILNMTSLIRLLEIYNTVEWQRVVFDEADSFVPTNLRLFPYRFTWFVSATWRLLARFVSPLVSSSSHHRRTNINHFHRRCLYNVPIEHIVVTPTIQLDNHLPPVDYVTHLFQNSASHFTNIVRDHIPHHVRQQIAADDIRGAMVSLGGTVDSTHSIVDLVKQQIHERVRTAESNIRLIEQSNRTDPRRLQLWRDRLAKENRSLTEVSTRFEESLNDACVICFEQPMQNPTLTKCHHMGCLHCLLQWWDQSKTCPVCRTPMNTSDMRTFQKNQSTINEEKKMSVTDVLPTSRTSALKYVLDHLPEDAKIAIFAEHSGSFDTIDRFIYKLDGTKFPRLKGSSTERRNLIQQLRAGTIRILLLNSREDSAGIHLPELTDVVLFHDMSADIKLQAVGRGQRIGRTFPLRVHSFVEQIHIE